MKQQSCFIHNEYKNGDKPILPPFSIIFNNYYDVGVKSPHHRKRRNMTTSMFHWRRPAEGGFFNHLKERRVQGNIDVVIFLCLNYIWLLTSTSYDEILPIVHCMLRKGDQIFNLYLGAILQHCPPMKFAEHLMAAIINPK